jgi:hypothetical protein
LEKEFPTPSAFVLKELAARDRVTLRKSLRNGGLRESKEMGYDRGRKIFCPCLVPATQGETYFSFRTSSFETDDVVIISICCPF